MKKISSQNELLQRLHRRYLQRLLNRRFIRALTLSGTFGLIVGGLSALFCAGVGLSLAYAGLILIFSFLGMLAGYFIRTHQPDLYDAALHAESVGEGCGALALMAEHSEADSPESSVQSALETLQRAHQATLRPALTRFRRWSLVGGLLIAFLGFVGPFISGFSPNPAPKRAIDSEELSTRLKARAAEDAIQSVREALLEGESVQAPQSRLKERSIQIKSESSAAKKRLSAAKALKKALTNNDQEAIKAAEKGLEHAGYADLPEGAEHSGEKAKAALLAAAEKAIEQAEAELRRLDRDAERVASLMEHRSRDDASLAERTGVSGSDDQKKAQRDPAGSIVRQPLRISSGIWASRAKKRSSPQLLQNLAQIRFRESLASED